MNRELVQALARLLVADVRRSISDPVSGVAPPGDARAIVGKLHPPIPSVDAPGASLQAVAARRRNGGMLPGVHSDLGINARVVASRPDPRIDPTMASARPRAAAALPPGYSSGESIAVGIAVRGRRVSRGRRDAGLIYPGHGSGPASLVGLPGPEGGRR